MYFGGSRVRAQNWTSDQRLYKLEHENIGHYVQTLLWSFCRVNGDNLHPLLSIVVTNACANGGHIMFAAVQC